MMEKGEVFQSGLADLLGRTKASTPHAELLRQLLDSRIPKTEREHAAVREIERLTAEIERLTDAALQAQNAAIDLAQQHKRLHAENERLRGLLAETQKAVWMNYDGDLLDRIEAALKEVPR